MLCGGGALDCAYTSKLTFDLLLFDDADVELVVEDRDFGRPAESWKKDPPFPGDNPFGDAMAEYERLRSCVEALGALNG